MHSKTNFFIAILIMLVTFPSFGSTNKTTVGRYLSVANKPTQAQVNLLSQQIEVHFPDSVQTIGDAIRYLLRYSGYSLIDNHNETSYLKATLEKPLPLVDRNFGPMSLRDGLSTLAGLAFILMQDPLNREINFKLNPTVGWRRG